MVWAAYVAQTIPPSTHFECSHQIEEIKFMKLSWRVLGIFSAVLLLAAAAAFVFWTRALAPGEQVPVGFDGQRAYAHVLAQNAFGPRTPGSEGHARLIAYAVQELEASGWQVEIQEAEMLGHPIKNIVAKRGQGPPWVIFGAHYDTRFVADQDPDPAQRTLPVPGANDGGSGVAVLLELAHVLPQDLSSYTWAGQIWLVMFDAEDQGRLPGWDWILGSQAFADRLQTYPDAVVIVDMIGDADLNIYREGSSDQRLTDQIWATAAELGYGEQFIDAPKYSMIDDHTPFVNLGIPAVDLIDFDYPYWHTTADTPDKVSAASLEAVGRTLMEWLRMAP
jgi:glutaminyl-peptide cyclotransferase